MAISAHLDSKSGMLGLCSTTCYTSQKMKTLEGGFVATWPFQPSMQPRKSAAHEFPRRRKFLCCSQISVVESDERSGVSSTDELIWFDNPTSLPLVEFKMSDFELCANVSIGLAGRADEVVYEAIVRNPDSPLKGSKVVLRQLDGPRAQRWRKHSLQVIKKLIRQTVMYQSYATQIYGFIMPHGVEKNMLTLVHGYYDNYSLHHWLLCEDWLPTLESRLALDEECARRVGDDRIGGPAVSRQLRLVQILMRDLLIGVNYLHCHGFAHTELRLQNVQISATDRHIKVGLLGNACQFEASSESKEFTPLRKQVNRRQLMIAHDIRCVGLMMARMVLRELMDPSYFEHFKSFLQKGNDPAALREFLVPLLTKKTPGDNTGLQVLDRNRGAGWNLLALMLASKPLERISCTVALRHPFLCGPKWRVETSIDMTRWRIGSTAVRIVEEYNYAAQQRTRLAQLIHVLELLNPNPSPEGWSELLPGKWRLLYHTGRHVGLTWRKGSPAVMVGEVYQAFADVEGELSTSSSISFSAMRDKGDWMPDKSGTSGKFSVSCKKVSLHKGERKYTTDLQTEPDDDGDAPDTSARLVEGFYNQIKRKGFDYPREQKIFQSMSTPSPTTLPIVRFGIEDVDMTMEVDYRGPDPSFPMRSLEELRVQIPPESFDISKIACGTYIDARLLVLRGLSGAALLFVRSAVTS